jgi:hypothetical protein
MKPVFCSKYVAPALTSVGFVSVESPIKRLFVAPIGSFDISKTLSFGVKAGIHPRPLKIKLSELPER